MTDRETIPPGGIPEQFATMFSDWQKVSVGMVSWTDPVWAKTASAMGAEITQFVGDRIREDIKTQGEILQCRDPVELREIQGRFLKTAFDQYCAETGKLVRMSQVALDVATRHGTGG